MAQAVARFAAEVNAGPRNERRKRFFDRYEWWFVVLGLVGNALFFFGSVAFLFKSLETLAISFFIAGSCFMLVSSSAQSISEYSSSKTGASSG